MRLSLDPLEFDVVTIRYHTLRNAYQTQIELEFFSHWLPCAMPAVYHLSLQY